MVQKKSNEFILKILLIAAVLAASFFVLGRIAGSYGKAQMNAMAEEYDSVRASFVDRQSGVVTAASAVFSADPELCEDYDTCVEFLKELKSGYEDISAAYIVNLDWEIPVIMDNGWMPPEDYPIAERPWYKGAVSSVGELYMTAPYYDEQSGSYCCTFSELVYDANEKEVGVFAIDFYLDSLVGILKESYTEDGYAFLVDMDGNIINHPNSEYQMSDTSTANIKDTPYAAVMNTSGNVTIRDYDGTKSVCYVMEGESHFFRIVAVQTWWSVYGKVVMLSVLLMGLFILFTAWLVLQARSNHKEMKAANDRLKDALVEAEAANTAKTEFISRISHDIRTPIGAILNLSEFAKQDLDSREKLSGDIDKIHSSGTFLLSLINDVLDISKVDSGRIELHPEPYDYKEYIYDLKNILEPMCSEKGVELSFESHHTENRYIMADKVRLRQIALNILSNAVKYTPKGGKVTYESLAEPLDDKRLSFTMKVTDTGIGMSGEFLTKVFDEFSQETDNPYREKAMTGTGLGMSIVKKMVDLMGGTIDIQSELGKGTCVTITLPLETVSNEEAEKILGVNTTDDSELTPLNVRVLLAEDNEINTMIAIRTLEEMGVTAEHASNGQEAVDLFQSSAPQHFRAVFMDLQMPVMDGYTAARTIRQMDRSDAASVPIIAMTADAYTEAMEKAKESGMSGFLTKPLEAGKIRETLENLLK